MIIKERMKEGFIYIVSNDAFPGFYKVGVTANIQSRLRIYQTSDPRRKYKMEFYIFHPDCYKAEQKLKETMKPFALEIKGEWYEIDLEMAKSRLEESLESYNNGEWLVE